MYSRNTPEILRNTWNLVSYSIIQTDYQSVKNQFNRIDFWKYRFLMFELDDLAYQLEKAGKEVIRMTLGKSELPLNEMITGEMNKAITDMKKCIREKHTSHGIQCRCCWQARSFIISTTRHWIYFTRDIPCQKKISSNTYPANTRSLPITSQAELDSYIANIFQAISETTT